MNEKYIVEEEEIKEIKEVEETITDDQCIAIILIASAVYFILGVLSIVAYCCSLRILTMILMVGIGGISILAGIFLFAVVLYHLFTGKDI